MSEEGTITQYPQAVEDAPTMVLRWIPRKTEAGVTSLVLQQQWKVREPALPEPMNGWRFEWRDIPFDPHGGA
jgi:hypothetical protein